MTIPFPDRISMFPAMAFALMLTVMLMASGTGALFCLLAGIFVVLAAIAFNIAGGLTRPSGSYVFFFAILAVIVGLVVKVVLWEPADLILRVPLITMGAYTAGMLMMLVAAYLSRRFSSKKGWLEDMVTTENLRLAAIGCVVGGFGIPILAGIALSSGSALLAPIATATLQLNRFLPMAIILGVTYEVKASAGKRSINASVLCGMALIFFQGVILNYSKEALFTPLLCWIASAAALRYRFSPYQVLGGLVAMVFIGVYMVPYCQYGRSQRNEQTSVVQQTEVAWSMLTDLNGTREKYKISEGTEVHTDQSIYFFRNSEGIFDRLTMFGIDDALNEATERKGPFGLSPFTIYFASVVPRVFWKNKPFVMMGNVFAHDVGLNENDTTTGVSFSPVAEAYHEAKWVGVLMVAPAVWALLFLVFDSLCGDVRKSPWGILALALFAHTAPEGMLQGATYMMTYGALIVTLVAFFSAYVMPMLSSLVAPPKKRISGRGVSSVAGAGRVGVTGR